MSTSNLFEKYRFFLRDMVDNKYLQHYDNVKVLGENIINSTYVVLFESTTDFGIKRYVLIENIEKPIIAEIKERPKNDAYVTMNKKDLSQIIPPKLYENFAKRGLATTVEIGLRLNKRFSWHRLVACLYYDCLGKEIHHIDKCEENNNINNLLPLSPSRHKKIDKSRNFRSSSLILQDVLKAKIQRKHHQTIATNEELLIDLLMYKSWGNTRKELISKFKQYFKKSSVYKYAKYFFYAQEFLIYPQRQLSELNWELYGKMKNRWENIIKFES